MATEHSSIRSNKLREVITLVNEDEWRTPKVPTIQKLHQAEKTPELMAYMEQISGVVNYVNQTFGLFKKAEEIRPAKLFKVKE